MQELKPNKIPNLVHIIVDEQNSTNTYFYWQTILTIA